MQEERGNALLIGICRLGMIVRADTVVGRNHWMATDRGTAKDRSFATCLRQ
jgi:hypothetical protein